MNMKISLKKAATLVSAITEQLQTIALITDKSVGEFDDISVVDDASVELADKIEKKLNLLEVQYAIRKKVATANFENDIDHVLNHIALLDKKLSLITVLAKSKDRIDNEILSKMLQKLRERKSGGESFYDNDIFKNVTTSVITKETRLEYEKLVKQLNKEKAEKKEELLKLNMVSEIDLSDFEVKILEDVGLV